MAVSRQAESRKRAAETGPRARMKRTMLDTSLGLMEQGLVPSVSDVAEAAGVSRATAYRYFPSQAAMIQAAVSEALGPILDWSSESADAETRIAELLDYAYPRIDAYEATHRATLHLALDQWRRRQTGTLGGEEEVKRGHRRDLLAKAVTPLKRTVSRQTFDRLIQSLSLIFGAEAMVVFKDIWGLDEVHARRVAIWAAQALVRAAVAEKAPVGRARNETRQAKSGGKSSKEEGKTNRPRTAGTPSGFDDGDSDRKVGKRSQMPLRAGTVRKARRRAALAGVT